MQTMSAGRADMARFYLDAFASNRTLHAQWEDGDYSAAEESFLAINRQGVPLDDLESLLIEYRNSSMARVIMSIANAGSAGHYWPPPASASMPEPLTDKLSTFDRRCASLHRTLFVPPFDAVIRDINVPFIVAPGHFRLQQHLIELIPLLAEGEAVGAERLRDILGRDSAGAVQNMVINADELITKIERKLQHIGGRQTDSLSLGLVPLIYWYNRRASFVRALMYAWMHWLLSGTASDIQERKIIFSSVRGELEDALIKFKDEFADIQHRAGAGLKSLTKLTLLIQNLVSCLHNERNLSFDEKQEKLAVIFGVRTPLPPKSSRSRSFSRTSRAEINVRSLLGAPLRCEICSGVVDLKQGIQYDHLEEFSAGGNSDSQNGRITHPFCNLFRTRIESLRAGREHPQLPPVTDDPAADRTFIQLTLFDAFPGA